MNNSEMAERSLLGTFMLNPEAAKLSIDMISVDEFSDGLNAKIFKAACDIVNEGNVVDLSTLFARLANDKLFIDRGGVGFLADLMQIVPNCQLIPEYIRTIKREARRRNLIRDLTGRLSELNNPENDPDSILLNILDNGRDSLQNSLQSSDKSMKDCIESAYKELLNKEDGTERINTGFDSLDNVLCFLPKGSLTIIAARPAMGKTAFGLNVMINQCVKRLRHGAFFSLEMSSTELAKRIIAQLAHVPGNAIRTGEMIESDWEKVLSVAEKYSAAPLFIDDSSDSSVERICSKIRQMKYQRKIDFVAIDYIQLMTSSSKKATNREQEVSIISRRLKMLAKELDIPIIALAQLNRAVDSRTDKRPFMSDLRESGSIEQNADNIIFLHRPGYYNADCQNPDDAEIIIAKQRAGSTGIVHLIWNAEQTRFCEPLSEF